VSTIKINGLAVNRSQMKYIIYHALLGEAGALVVILNRKHEGCGNVITGAPHRVASCEYKRHGSGWCSIDCMSEILTVNDASIEARRDRSLYQVLSGRIYQACADRRM